MAQGRISLTDTQETSATSSKPPTTRSSIIMLVAFGRRSTGSVSRQAPTNAAAEPTGNLRKSGNTTDAVIAH